MVLVTVIAASTFPVRMRVVNVWSQKVEWLTVAVIPQMEEILGTISKEKAAHLRSLFLKKTLHLILRSIIQASHHGARLRLSDGREVIVSARLLVYKCDYLEQRAVLGLKNHGAAYDCTSCMAPSVVSCTSSGLHHPDRPVLPPLDAKLKAAEIQQTRGCTQTATGVSDCSRSFRQ